METSPDLSPALYSCAFTREELVSYYSLRGLPIADIISLLFEVHGYRISKRHLIRLRNKLGVSKRSMGESPLSSIVAAIEKELSGSGSLMGYRSMWSRLTISYGLIVKRDTVMMLLSLLDPSGSECRKKRRIKRRIYRSKGPNFMWHMDGYDKMKPFGIAIHGCIDGYSRRIMWAQVSHSNNNPNIIAQFYLDTITSIRGVPSILRTDRGTENSVVAFLQPAFRNEGTDSHASERSFQYGRSSANQRIEAWWSYLRSHMTDWWINYFKDLQLHGYFDNTQQHNIDALRYCFGPVVQKQLADLVIEWNHHRVRKTATAEAPGGVPEVLYFSPESSGGEDFKCAVDSELLSHARQEYGYGNNLFIDEDYKSYADAVCTQFGLQYPPTTHDEALQLYFLLIDDYNSLT